MNDHGEETNYKFQIAGKLNPLKKSSLGVIASEAKQSHGIATAPSGPRNDFFRGFKLQYPNYKQNFYKGVRDL
jgi:hypothetical protein